MKRWFTSIRAKLGITIGLLVAITVGGSSVALLGFEKFSAITDAIVAERFPEVRKANTLAKTAHAIAASAPAIAVAPDIANLEDEFRRTASLLTNIRWVEDFSGQDIQGIPEILGRMETLLAQIRDSRHKSLTTQARIASHLRKAASVHQEFQKALQPIRDTAGFKVILTLLELSDLSVKDADTWRAQAFDTDLPNFQHSIELTAQVEATMNLLHQALGTHDIPSLEALGKKFSASIETMRITVNNLADGSATHKVEELIDDLVTIGSQDTGIFSLRREQLALDIHLWQQMEDARNIATDLANRSNIYAAEVIEQTRNDAHSLQRVLSRNQIFFLAASLAAILLATFTAWHIVARGITARLLALRSQMKEGQSGNLDITIDTSGNDEIADMAKALEYFLDELKHDTLEKQKAAAALRASEDHLRRILETSSEGFIMVDNELGIRNVNQSMCTILGATREELFDQPIYDIIPDEEKPALRRNLMLREIGETNSYEIRLKRRDGSLANCLFNATPLLSSSGDKIGSFAMVTDITARKESEEALRKSEHHHRTIFENSPLGILRTDTMGTIIDCNSKLCSILDKGKGELIGYNLRTSGNETFSQALITALRGKSASFEGSFSVSPSDLPRPLSFAFNPVLPGGSPTEVVATVEDITARKVMEHELVMARDEAEAATRAKSEFLTNISHEIRTPMNAVMGMAHLALKTELTDKQRDYITKIDNAARMLLHLINDILDFSSLESGTLSLDYAPMHMKDVLNSLRHFVALRAEDKDIHFGISLHPDTPATLMGDALRLGQVLKNLLDNAIKFTESGHIDLIVEQQNADADSVTLHFAVSDSGTGIPQAQIATLFRPFSQVDASTTRQFGGVGLGLSICSQLIELMEGHLWVESEEGQGSIFHFTARFGKHHEKRFEPQRLPQEILNHRALVVDDNSTSQQIFESYLEDFNMDAVFATSATEALDILQTDNNVPHIALVITDWKMPMIDGTEFTRRIKHDDTLPLCPKVIMTTAYPQDDVMQTALNAGVDAFLIKPVNQAILFDTILEVFNYDSAGKEHATLSDTSSEKPHADADRLSEVLSELQDHITTDSTVSCEPYCETLRNYTWPASIRANIDTITTMLEQKRCQEALPLLEMTLHYFKEDEDDTP